MTKKIISIAVLIFIYSTQNEIRAVTLNQIDDFEDTSLQTAGWRIGLSSLAIRNITTGGPDGTNDNFLQYTSSGGGGRGSRMVFFNQDQWQGNYVAAGINAIRANIKNLHGSTPLKVRVALGDSSTSPGCGTSGGSWFISSNSLDLSASGDWLEVTFSLAEKDLTRISGNSSYTDTMSSVRELRILSQTSNANPSVCGDSISGIIGLDNITAITQIPACSITALTSGTQSLCNPATNTYTQDIKITYKDPPATGMLDINGQLFDIDRSSSSITTTHTLTNLTANGQTVNVTAFFTADQSCSNTTSFTSRADCTNSPPAIDLDADDSSGSSGSNFQTIFSLGGNPVDLADGIGITDVDSSNLITSAAITLTNALDSGLEFININTALANSLGIAVAVSSNSQSLTLSGTASRDHYEMILETAQYQNLNFGSSLTNRTVSFTVNDGLDASPLATTTIIIQNGTLEELMTTFLPACRKRVAMDSFHRTQLKYLSGRMSFQAC